jgi:hypothetical protein
MPALSDGRCFTNYLPGCEYDRRLQTKFSIPDGSTAYRMFLQNNAMEVQQATRQLHVCAFAFDRIDTGPTLPPTSPGPSYDRRYQ